MTQKDHKHLWVSASNRTTILVKVAKRSLLILENLCQGLVIMAEMG
jgi:hypothetical protein